MNVVIPPNLKAGDTFEVSVPVAIPTVAAIPAAPPPPRTPITEAEALCYNLRHSVMCYAILQSIGRQRMSEVEQQGRRAVLVYY